MEGKEELDIHTFYGSYTRTLRSTFIAFVRVSLRALRRSFWDSSAFHLGEYPHSISFPSFFSLATHHPSVQNPHSQSRGTRNASKAAGSRSAEHSADNQYRDTLQSRNPHSQPRFSSLTTRHPTPTHTLEPHPETPRQNVLLHLLVVLLQPRLLHLVSPEPRTSYACDSRANRSQGPTPSKSATTAFCPDTRTMRGASICART